MAEHDRIEDVASQPRRASGDSGSVETHALSEQIEADKYLAAKRATAMRGLGIRRVKLIPPGAG